MPTVFSYLAYFLHPGSEPLLSAIFRFLCFFVCAISLDFLIYSFSRKSMSIFRPMEKIDYLWKQNFNVPLRLDVSLISPDVNALKHVRITLRNIDFELSIPEMREKIITFWHPSGKPLWNEIDSQERKG